MFLNFTKWTAGNVFLFHIQYQAFGMGIEIGRVHALDFGDAGLVAAFELHPQLVFKDIGAFGQVVDKEMAGCVFGRLVIGQAVMVAVAGEDIDRLKAAAAQILQVHVFT